MVGHTKLFAAPPPLVPNITQVQTNIFKLGVIHMNTDTKPLLVSLNDAAKSIGVCRATFYKLLDQDCFENVKIGTRRLIVQESLIAYVESLKTKAAE